MRLAGAVAILLALAILSGHFLFLRAARLRALDIRVAANLSAFLLCGGLIGGHQSHEAPMVHANCVSCQKHKVL